MPCPRRPSAELASRPPGTERSFRWARAPSSDRGGAEFCGIVFRSECLRGSRSDHGFGVEGSQTLANSRQDGGPNRKRSVQEIVETLVRHREKTARRCRRSSCRAWPAIEKRDLAKEVSCSDGVDRPATSLDEYGSRHDHEEITFVP